MALLRYFKRDDSKAVLPNPEGPLSSSMPSSRIKAANDLVEPLVTKQDSRSRGRYECFTEEEKALIGKRACEVGVTNAIRALSARYPEKKLKESSVRTWMNKYKKELVARKKSGKSMDIVRLERKKMGRPLLLNEKLDQEVQAYLRALREKGAVVNSAIVIACAEGVVKNVDSNLLLINGGYVSFSKQWARHMLHRMGYTKRRANSKVKVPAEQVLLLKAQFLFDIKSVVVMEDVPKELIIN